MYRVLKMERHHLGLKAFVCLIVIFRLEIVCLDATYALTKQSYFERNMLHCDLQGKSLWRKMHIGQGQCFQECHFQDACRSVTYNVIKSTCTGHDVCPNTCSLGSSRYETDEINFCKKVIKEVGRNKPASMSSRFKYKTEFYSAAFGNDGLNILEVPPGMSTYHYQPRTTAENNPWWMVDLQQSYLIYYVRIMSRRPKVLNSFLGNIELRVREDGEAFDKLCGKYDGLVPSRTNISIPCAAAVKGRFVILKRKGRHVLCFCEIWIYAAV